MVIKTQLSVVEQTGRFVFMLQTTVIGIAPRCVEGTCTETRARRRTPWQ